MIRFKNSITTTLLTILISLLLQSCISPTERIFLDEDEAVNDREMIDCQKDFDEDHDFCDHDSEINDSTPECAFDIDCYTKCGVLDGKCDQDTGTCTCS